MKEALKNQVTKIKLEKSRRNSHEAKNLRIPGATNTSNTVMKQKKIKPVEPTYQRKLQSRNAQGTDAAHNMVTKFRCQLIPEPDTDQHNFSTTRPPTGTPAAGSLASTEVPTGVCRGPTEAPVGFCEASRVPYNVEISHVANRTRRLLMYSSLAEPKKK